MSSIYQYIHLQWFAVAMSFVPIAASISCSAINNIRFKRAIGVAGIAVSFIAACGILVALLGLEGARPSFITGEIIRWLNVDPLCLSIGFRVDEISLWFVGAAAVLSAVAVSYAIATEYEKWDVLNLFVGSFFIVITADNIGFMLIGWLLLGAALYLLANRCVVTLISSLFLIAGCVLIATTLIAYGESTSMSLSWESLENDSLYLAPVALPLSALLVFAAILRMGVWPFQGSLEKGQGDSISLLASNAFATAAGAYLLIRCHVLIVLSPVVVTSIKYIGLAAIVASVILAMRSRTVLKMMSASSAFYASLVILCVGCGGFAQALLLAFIHMLAKGAMSLSCAPSLSDYKGGLVKIYPISGWCFVASAFFLAGVVPFGPYFVLESALWVARVAGWFMWAAVLISCALLAFSIMRVAGAFFLGRRTEYPKASVELPAYALIGLAILATIVAIFSFMHLPPFLGGSYALGILGEILPAPLMTDDWRKFSAAVFLFAVAQPAIISAALYAQRKLKAPKQKPPIIVFENIPIPNEPVMRAAMDDIIMGSLARGFGLLLLGLRWVGDKLLEIPLVAIIVALLLITITVLR